MIMPFAFTLIFALGIAMAYANGANDVSKAIATLVGSGVTNYRRAILWGTVCTGIGSLFSVLIAGALISTFTKGFIGASVTQTESFALAVLLGAILWVFLATSTGLPVSTTHAITGSIVGVGATRRWSAVRWGVAGQIVWAWVLTIPMAATIAAITFWIARFFGAH